MQARIPPNPRVLLFVCGTPFLFPFRVRIKSNQTVKASFAFEPYSLLTHNSYNYLFTLENNSLTPTPRARSRSFPFNPDFQVFW
jgi:hypothetical protein